MIGTSEVRWYTLFKAADGSTTSELAPPVRRETASRALLANDLRRAASHRALQALLDEPETDFGRAAMLTLADALDAAVQEDLPESVLESLEAWADHLSGEISDRAPLYISRLPETLEQHSACEREDRPTIAPGSFCSATTSVRSITRTT